MANNNQNNQTNEPNIAENEDIITPFDKAVAHTEDIIAEIEQEKTQSGNSIQELFDQVLAKIKENLDLDILANTKTQEQADFIFNQQTSYLKTYLKL